MSVYEALLMIQQPIGSPVLVGRNAELDALRDRLTEASTGSGSTFLIAGEAGIGKSRLVGEIASQAGNILRGNSFEPDSTLPFAPIIDLLRSCFSSQSVDETLQIIGSDATAIARLLPELSATGASLAIDFSSGPDKHRLFQSLNTFFARRATSTTLLIVVEDLHWADDTSLEYLLHLARLARTLPVLMLLTYRIDETGPALQSLLASLDRERLAAEIVLRPLGIVEVDAQLRAMFEQTQPIRRDFLLAVYELTQGNPFFVEEVISALVASGGIYLDGNRWDRKDLTELTIPRSVQHAVVRRLDALGTDARDVLRIAAVAGQRFSLNVLLDLSGLDEPVLLGLIRELIAARLVVEVSAERFAFRHALTRQAVYEDMLTRERQVIHGRIGEAIESHSLDVVTQPVSELAYHYHAAGFWEKALLYASLAGRQARELYAPRPAVEHFNRALDAARHLNVAPDLSLYRERGLANATLGEFEQAQRDFETVLERSRMAGDQPTEWQALFDLGALFLGLDYDLAGDFLLQALAIARELGDRDLVGRSLVQVGNWQVNTEQIDDARQSLQTALVVFEEIGDQHAIAETLDLLGVSEDAAGNTLKMREYHFRALALYRKLDDRGGISSALANLSSSAGMAVFDASAVPPGIAADQVDRWIDESLEIARDIHWRAGEAYSLLNRGMYDLHHGRFDRIFDLARLTMAISVEIGHSEWLTCSNLLNVLLSIHLLEPSKALAANEEAFRLAQESGSLYFSRVTAGLLATARIVEKDFDGAQLLLETFDANLPMQTAGQRWIWLARARLALTGNRAQYTLDIIDRLYASAPGFNSERDMPQVAHLRGETMIALNEYEHAEVSLRNAITGASEQSIRPVLWQAQLTLGLLYQDQHRDNDAERELGLAWRIVEEMADTIPGDDLRETFLMRAGERFADGHLSRNLDHRLTAREQDVVQLLAKGLTNREIGEVLFISERTVETHVSNTLAKLNFRSRT